MPQHSTVLSARKTRKLEFDEIFRRLVDSVAEYAIFIVDSEGRVESWNLGAERMKGYTAEEIIGKHFSVFYTPADCAENVPAQDLRTAAKNGNFEDIGWRIRKNGSRFWASAVISRIEDANGNLLGYGCITRDLSERRLSELRYRLLVEGVIDYAIFSMDPKGYITSWNLGAERIKGYKPEEIIGKHFSIFYTDEDRAAGLPETVLQTATSEEHFAGEGWRVRKDGSRFWSSIVVTALRDDEGNLYGFSKVTRDMTERKQLLDAVEHHSRELELRVQEREESNAELEAFAYSVSHDLRAPLRAIAGFAGALREDCGASLDDRGRDYLSEITSAASRMNILVQDLLDYGRVSRIDMPIESIRLADAVANAIDQLKDDRRGSLTVSVPSDLFVEGHPRVLPQVILNFLTNAFKFHFPHATPDVRVAAERRDGHVRLNVYDNGIGIEAKHQERIWQVFERLHERETYPGSGIGLAIVKRAVTRMNGRYGVESVPGDGSTFWIELAESPEQTKVTNG